MLEKLFEEGLFNYQDLVIKYHQKLNLSANEVIVLIQLLSLALKRRYNLSTNSISRLTTLKMNEVGEIINELFDKNLISIYFASKSDKKVGEMFSLKPFFAKVTEIIEGEIKKQKELQNITDIEKVIQELEKAFQRPLSPTNLEIIKQWFFDDFSKEQITKALEVTISHKRKTVAYVDRVLRSRSIETSSSIDEKTAAILRKLVGK